MTSSERPVSHRTIARKRGPQAAKRGALSQTVGRAVTILRAFTAERREIGISELSAELRLPKTIVFRLVQTLREYDLLERDPESAKYRIGLGAFEIGILFKNPELDREAAPFMRQLVDETGFTAQLALLSGCEAVIIARMEGRGPLRYGVSVGERRPLHSTAVGKAIASVLADDERDALLAQAGMQKRTSHTITDTRRLKADLAATRARGYAINWEENTVGVASIAAPIRPAHTHDFAAISIAFPASAVPKKTIPRLGRLVSAAASAIEERI